MTPVSNSVFDKAAFAENVRKKLASHRDVFVIDRDDHILASIGEQAAARDPAGRLVEGHKLVTAAALKLLLDYCESDWPNMSVVEYAAAVFHSRAPEANETLFDLLPEVQKRLTADRLGLGHIYK